MSEIDVSVVIPVWNGRPYLVACMEALLAQVPGAFRFGEGRVEVLCVDNASSDGSADFIEEHYPQARLIRNPVNRGFAGACNVGIEAASGATIALLNQDTRVRPGWLAALSDALTDARVGVVGCKALYPDGETIQHAGGRIQWPVAMAEHYGAGERDAGQWDTPREVDYVTGAAMAFRRDVLEAVGQGPLDEGFWPGYYEDVDLCYRVRAAGYEVWYIPSAVLIHEESPSLGGTARLSALFHQGRLRFVLKHLPPESFVRDFVPAERSTSLTDAQGELALALRTAYLGAMPLVGSLYARRWQADVEAVSAVLEALQQLYLHPVQDPEDAPIEPALDEFEFRSSTPILGPLIVRLRSLWYGAAARWAVRHLARQQEAVNRQLEVIRVRQDALNRSFVRSIVSLSQDLATLVVEHGGREHSQRTEFGPTEPDQGGAGEHL
jgi:GT2 family glycosyltransferase